METILKILLMCIGIGVFTVGLSYILKKYKIDANKYKQSSDFTKIIITYIKIILKEDDKFDDEEVDKFSNIAINILEHFDECVDKDKEYIIESSISIATFLCSELGIKLDADRIYIINNTINMMYNMYEDFNSQI